MRGLRFTRRARIIALGIGLGVSITAIGRALPIGTPNGSTPQPRYPAVVRCRAMAEDAAAHVRLVRFERLPDGRVVLVYRCERGW